MEFVAIQNFAEEINKENGLNLNFVVKSNFLETTYVLKNGEDVLKEHYDLQVLFAFLQGIKFMSKVTH